MELLKDIEKLNKDNLAFSFYAPLKNEDANPVIIEYKGENGDDLALLVVADGLGGSGGSPIDLTKDKINIIIDEISKEDGIPFSINNRIITEFDEVNDEKSFFDLTIKSIIENENNTVTNALIASRIVIYRYIKYLTNVILEKDLTVDLRKEIVAYIKETITNIKEKLDIEPVPPYTSILPTTLVSIRYNKTKKQIDVIWAGDSRAYLLTNKGLFQLSDDNEEDGLITNHFNYNSKVKLYLNTFPLEDLNIDDNKFILLVASDGMFDCFGDNDYFLDEYLLLDKIENNNSIKEISDNIKNHMVENHFTDDITLAFYPVGFNDLDDIKVYYKKRYDFINELHNDIISNEDYINMIENKECEEYIDGRIKGFTNKIKTFILDSNLEECEYFGFNRLHDARSNLIYKTITDLKIEDANKYIKSNTEIYEIINEYIKDKKMYDDYNLLINDLKSSIDLIKKIKDDIFDISIKETYNYQLLADNLKLIINSSLKNYYRPLYNELNKIYSDKKINSYLNTTQAMIINENKVFNRTDIRTTPRRYLGQIFDIYCILEDINVFLSNTDIIKKLEESIEDNNSKYIEFMDSVTSENIEKYFNCELLEEKLPSVKDIAKKKLDSLTIEEMLSGIKKILGYRDNTCIDAAFNKVQLDKYRLFIKLQNDEKLKNKVYEIKHELKELKDNYNKFIK